MVLGALVWQFGQFATFELRRQAVQREVKVKLKAGVPMSERVYFTFTADEFTDLHWLKPEKEFTLGEGFFDVIVKRVDEAGRIHLECMNDRQEAALFADLSHLVDRSMDSRGDGPQRAQYFFGLMKHWTSQDIAWRIHVPEADRTWPSLCDRFAVSQGPEPAFPPPRS